MGSLWVQSSNIRGVVAGVLVDVLLIQQYIVEVFRVAACIFVFSFLLLFFIFYHFTALVRMYVRPGPCI